MFSILNKTKSITSLDWLGVDIHSHLLPGVDDGCDNAAGAVKLINRLKLLGISEMYLTPLIAGGDRSLTQNSISNALLPLHRQIQVAKVDIAIAGAATYLADDGFAALYRAGKLVCLPGRYVLLELPFEHEPADIDQHLSGLTARGYIPVLAYPERYTYYHGDTARYKRYRDNGCLFQMNILSPEGYYGPHVKQASLRLLKEGMVDMIGTDLHHSREMHAIERFVLSGNAHKVFRKNPIRNAELFTNGEA